MDREEVGDLLTGAQVVGAEAVVALDDAKAQRLTPGVDGQDRRELHRGVAQDVEHRARAVVRREQRGDELHPRGGVGEEHVLLRREVAVERSRRDVDAVGDLVDARRVEALVGEELERRLDEGLTGGLLLALAEAGRHAAIVRETV